MKEAQLAEEGVGAEIEGYHAKHESHGKRRNWGLFTPALEASHTPYRPELTSILCSNQSRHLSMSYIHSPINTTWPWTTSYSSLRYNLTYVNHLMKISILDSIYTIPVNDRELLTAYIFIFIFICTNTWTVLWKKARHVL